MNTYLRTVILISFIGILTCQSLQAAYITDKLVIDLYPEKFEQGQLIKTLPSGTVIEVLEKEGGYAKIRTTDNIVGYIQLKYITNEKPVQMEYLQLVSKYNKLEEKIVDYQNRLTRMLELQKEVKAVDWVREQLKTEKTKNSELQKSLDLKDSVINERDQTVIRLETDLLKTKKQLNEVLESIRIQGGEEGKPSESMPLYREDVELAGSEPHKIYSWLVPSLFVTLAIGVLMGFVLIDYRIRKKHGVRLY